MEKRLVLALLLSLGAIILYSTFLTKQPAPRPAPEKPKSAAPAEPSRPAGAADSESQEPARPAEETAFPAVAAEKEEEIVLETESYRAVFTNRGGMLKQLRLKDYHPRARLSDEEKKREENWLLLLEERKKGSAALRLDDPFQKTGGDPARALWKTSRLPDGRGIEFAWSSGNGVTLRKRIVFPPGRHHALVDLEVENGNPAFTASDWTLEFSPSAGVAWEERDAQQFYPHPVSAAAYVKAGERADFKTFIAHGSPLPPEEPFHKFPPPSPEVSISFAGCYGKYFAALCLPQEGTKFAYAKAEALLDEKEIERKKLPAAAGHNLYRLSSVRCGISVHVPAPGSVERKSFLLYLGPKDPRMLESEANPEYGPLVAMIEDDYGWVGWLVPFLLWILKGLDFLVRNYGVAVILLTVLVRLALFPLSRKQQVTMAGYQKKMAKLQPQLEALKKKYKDQKQKLYEEQAKLFREHKITPPLMGCLPMLLQIPVFFALFRALGVAFELRQVPFLWVDDLSLPDRLIDFGGSYGIWFLRFDALNVLPIAMVVVWIWQQRAMPVPPDPQQAQMQKIMAWFPLLFGWMLYNYAAGLSLYMTVSSAWGIAEQKVIRKRIAAEHPPSG